MAAFSQRMPPVKTHHGFASQLCAMVILRPAGVSEQPATFPVDGVSEELPTSTSGVARPSVTTGRRCRHALVSQQQAWGRPPRQCAAHDRQPEWFMPDLGLDLDQQLTQKAVAGPALVTSGQQNEHRPATRSEKSPM
jgi:hypothetical protein